MSRDPSAWLDDIIRGKKSADPMVWIDQIPATPERIFFERNVGKAVVFYDTGSDTLVLGVVEQVVPGRGVELRPADIAMLRETGGGSVVFKNVSLIDSTTGIVHPIGRLAYDLKRIVNPLLLERLRYIVEIKE